MYLMFFASFQVLMLLMTEMMEIDRYVDMSCFASPGDGWV